MGEYTRSGRLPPRCDLGHSAMFDSRVHSTPERAKALRSGGPGSGMQRNGEQAVTPEVQQSGVFVLAIFLAVLAERGWQWLRRRAARQWPLTEGRVERAEWRQPNTGTSRYFVADLAYSYVVGGQYYAGYYRRSFSDAASGGGVRAVGQGLHGAGAIQARGERDVAVAGGEPGGSRRRGGGDRVVTNSTTDSHGFSRI